MSLRTIGHEVTGRTKACIQVLEISPGLFFSLVYMNPYFCFFQQVCSFSSSFVSCLLLSPDYVSLLFSNMTKIYKLTGICFKQPRESSGIFKSDFELLGAGVIFKISNHL